MALADEERERSSDWDMFLKEHRLLSKTNRTHQTQTETLFFKSQGAKMISLNVEEWPFTVLYTTSTVFLAAVLY